MAAVVLAAGASTRLGSPKQLVMLGGETLLERAGRIAREAGCTPVIVVLGASAAVIMATCKLSDATVIINADWEEGMAASIACGVAAVGAQVNAQANAQANGDIDGIVLMACDQPAITVEHLRMLIDSQEIAASGYAGRRGVPAYFPATSFEDLMELRGDAGARGLLKDAGLYELAGGELDVDTMEDLERVRTTFA